MITEKSRNMILGSPLCAEAGVQDAAYSV